MQGLTVLFSFCVFIIACVSFPSQILERMFVSVDLQGSFGGILGGLLLCFPLQLPIPRFLFPPCICRAVLTSCCIQRGSPRCYVKAGDSVFVCWLVIDRRLSLAARWVLIFEREEGFIDRRHAPWRAERVRENKMSPRRSLTGFQHELPGEQMQRLNKPHFLFAACSPSQSAPLLQFHSTSGEELLLNNPSVHFFFFCHFEAWEKNIFTYPLSY